MATSLKQHTHTRYHHQHTQNPCSPPFHFPSLSLPHPSSSLPPPPLILSPPPSLSSPSIIVVQDSWGYIFGGYIAHALEHKGFYYGNGESFVLSLAGRSMLKVYAARGIAVTCSQLITRIFPLLHYTNLS